MLYDIIIFVKNNFQCRVINFNNAKSTAFVKDSNYDCSQLSPCGRD